MDSQKLDLYSSSHFELYPEHYKNQMTYNKKFETEYNNFTNYIINCSKNDVNPFN